MVFSCSHREPAGRGDGAAPERGDRFLRADVGAAAAELGRRHPRPVHAAVRHPASTRRRRHTGTRVTSRQRSIIVVVAALLMIN